MGKNTKTNLKRTGKWNEANRSEPEGSFGFSTSPCHPAARLGAPQSGDQASQLDAGPDDCRRSSRGCPKPLYSKPAGARLDFPCSPMANPKLTEAL